MLMDSYLLDNTELATTSSAALKNYYYFYSKFPSHVPGFSPFRERSMICNANGTVMQPKGAVGVIVRSPADLEHSYFVKFPDVTESAMKRSAIQIRKHFQAEGMDGPRIQADDPALRDSITSSTRRSRARASPTARITRRPMICCCGPAG